MDNQLNLMQCCTWGTRYLTHSKLASFSTITHRAGWFAGDCINMYTNTSYIFLLFCTLSTQQFKMLLTLVFYLYDHVCLFPRYSGSEKEDVYCSETAIKKAELQTQHVYVEHP